MLGFCLVFTSFPAIIASRATDKSLPVGSPLLGLLSSNCPLYTHFKSTLNTKTSGVHSA